jgi:hypothetical protein
MEKSFFKDVHKLTSSVLFLQALRDKDLELCKKLAAKNPMAVKTTESREQQFSAAHIAVDLNDLSLLKFLDTL